MSFDDAIILAGKVLKENLEQKINKDNFEIWYIKKGDGKIVSLSPEELEKLIPKF
jgi:20S proteasome alpha/beta subunit